MKSPSKEIGSAQETEALDQEDSTDAQSSAIRVRGLLSGADVALAFIAFIETIAMPAWVHDMDTGELLAVNAALLDLTKRPREGLIGASALEVFEASERGAVAHRLHQLRSQLPSDATHELGPVKLLVRGGRAVRVMVSSRPAPAVRSGARLAVAREIHAGESAELVSIDDVTVQDAAQSELLKRARTDAFRADLGAAMTSDEPLPSHLERVVLAMEHHLDLSSVGIWVVDEATGQLELKASVGALDITTAGGRRLGFGETWIGRAAARSSQILLDTFDPAMRPLEAMHAQKLGVTHVAAFPLVVRRRVLGVVTASRTATFPEDLVGTLAGTATQIAQALGTAFAYEALRVSESLSRSILGNMPSGLVTLDESGIIETVNAAAASMLGCAREELCGRSFASLFDVPSNDPKLLLSQARGRVSEWKGRRKNGDRFPCELRVFYLDSLRGPGYAAIVNDVSERYEIERMKSEFVSVVSHELRTPLTALRGSIGLLAGGVLGALPAEVMELLGIAERNALRLISLVNDILDLERLQKGKMELFAEPVAARTIVDRSLDSVKAYADQERVTILVECADATLLGDGDRLVQVLVNLLSNAVKFSTPGSLVEVATAVELQAVVFRVRDHGRGIPASHRRIIFERFEQVRSSDAREKGGTGLGLAISKAIIEQHHGTIGVESEEGSGSTFWFRVPRAPL